MAIKNQSDYVSYSTYKGNRFFIKLYESNKLYSFSNYIIVVLNKYMLTSSAHITTKLNAINYNGSPLRNDPNYIRPKIVNSATAVSPGIFFPRKELSATADLLYR